MLCFLSSGEICDRNTAYSESAGIEIRQYKKYFNVKFLCTYESLIAKELEGFTDIILESLLHVHHPAFLLHISE